MSSSLGNDSSNDNSSSSSLCVTSPFINASSPLSLPVLLRFSGQEADFSVWKARMECYLEGEGLLEVTESAISDSVPRSRLSNGPNEIMSQCEAVQAQEEKRKPTKVELQSRRAYRILFLSLPDEIARGVLSIPRGNANAVWLWLLQRYEKRTRATQSQLRNELTNCKLKDIESIDEYASRIKQIVCRLQDMKVMVDDATMCHHFLMGLPQEYESTVEGLQILDDDSLTFEKAVIQISSSQERRKFKEGIHGMENASQQGAHYVRMVNGGSNSSGTYGANVRCFNCDQKGHFQKDCPNRRFKEKQVGYNSSNNIPEEDVNDNNCDYCGKSGHTIKYCSMKKANDERLVMLASRRQQKQQQFKQEKEHCGYIDEKERIDGAW
jgi:hypothetical protein